MDKLAKPPAPTGRPAVGFIDWLDLIGNIFNFDFYAAEPPSQKIVNCSEDHKENETENAHRDRHQNVDDRYDLEFLTAEHEHRNANQGVNKAHQDVESGGYFAGLQDGDSAQLFLHSL